MLSELATNKFSRRTLHLILATESKFLSFRLRPFLEIISSSLFKRLSKFGVCLLYWFTLLICYDVFVKLTYLLIHFYFIVKHGLLSEVSFRFIKLFFTFCKIFLNGFVYFIHAVFIVEQRPGVINGLQWFTNLLKRSIERIKSCLLSFEQVIFLRLFKYFLHCLRKLDCTIVQYMFQRRYELFSLLLDFRDIFFCNLCTSLLRGDFGVLWWRYCTHNRLIWPGINKGFPVLIRQVVHTFFYFLLKSIETRSTLTHLLDGIDEILVEFLAFLSFVDLRLQFSQLFKFGLHSSSNCLFLRVIAISNY